MLFWKFLHAFQGRGRQFYCIESFVVLNRFKERTNIENMKQEENGKKKMGKRSPRVWDLSYTLLGSQRRNDLGGFSTSKKQPEDNGYFLFSLLCRNDSSFEKSFSYFFDTLKGPCLPKRHHALVLLFWNNSSILIGWFSDFPSVQNSMRHAMPFEHEPFKHTISKNAQNCGKSDSVSV